MRLISIKHIENFITFKNYQTVVLIIGILNYFVKENFKKKLRIIDFSIMKNPAAETAGYQNQDNLSRVLSFL